MEQLGTPEATVDAVMMVHRPKERSPEVNEALAQADRYQFVQLSDEAPHRETVERTEDLPRDEAGVAGNLRATGNHLRTWTAAGQQGES